MTQVLVNFLFTFSWEHTSKYYVFPKASFLGGRRAVGFSRSHAQVTTTGISVGSSLVERYRFMAFGPWCASAGGARRMVVFSLRLVS